MRCLGLTVPTITDTMTGDYTPHSDARMRVFCLANTWRKIQQVKTWITHTWWIYQ